MHAGGKLAHRRTISAKIAQRGHDGQDGVLELAVGHHTGAVLEKQNAVSLAGSPAMLDLARDFGLVVMRSSLRAFEACGRLYEGGLGGKAGDAHVE